MQKARRHNSRCSDRLWADGFRVSFTPLFGVLFTFPSRYWFAIGLPGVFSLTGWSPLIHARFLVPRATQDATRPSGGSRVRGCHPLRPAVPGRSARLPHTDNGGPTTPTAPKRRRFGLFPFRSPLLGESLLFSFPAGTKMFQFPAFASAQLRGCHPFRMTGCPIRRPADRGLLAPPRGFSQLAASFIASGSLGIHRAPLSTSFA